MRRCCRPLRTKPLLGIPPKPKSVKRSNLRLPPPGGKSPGKRVRPKKWGYPHTHWNIASRSWESTSCDIAGANSAQFREQNPDTPAELVTANRAQPECPMSPRMVRNWPVYFVNQVELVSIPTNLAATRPIALQGRQNFITAE